MITDIIKIKGDGKGSDEALTATEKAAKYNDLTGKEAIRLRLLTEELIGMFHGVAGGNGDADFWIEENNKEYKKNEKKTYINSLFRSYGPKALITFALIVSFATLVVITLNKLKELLF